MDAVASRCCRSKPQQRVAHHTTPHTGSDVRTNPKFKGRPQWQRIEESELVLENSNDGEEEQEKGRLLEELQKNETRSESHRKTRQHDT